MAMIMRNNFLVVLVFLRQLSFYRRKIFVRDLDLNVPLFVASKNQPNKRIFMSDSQIFGMYSFGLLMLEFY